MNAFQEVLEYSFNQRALLAALMIGFTNGFLGGYIVLRKASLTAESLSHSIFPGIAIGALVAGLNPLSALLGAVFTASVVGLLAKGISVYSRIGYNTALAILTPVSYAVAILIIDNLGIYFNLKDYLFGNILGVSNFDLWFSYGVGLIVLSVLILFQRPLFLFLFSQDFALSKGVAVKRYDYLITALLVITLIASLQAVGIFLSLGLLIAPSAILYLFLDSPKKIIWGAGCIGATMSVFSVFLSNWLNIQTGACIVLLLGAMFILSLLFSPKYGVLKRFVQHHHGH